MGGATAGRAKRVCQGRGPFSHHTLQMKNDFNATIRIHVMCSRTEKILFSHLPGGIWYFPLLLFPKRCPPPYCKPGAPGPSSSSCLGSPEEVGIMGSSPGTSTEGPPGVCSWVAFSSACSWVLLQDLKKATKLGSRGKREGRVGEGGSSLTSCRPKT